MFASRLYRGVILKVYYKSNDEQLYRVQQFDGPSPSTTVVFENYFKTSRLLLFP